MDEEEPSQSRDRGYTAETMESETNDKSCHIAKLWKTLDEMTSMDVMREYDWVFRCCLENQDRLVYDAFVNVLTKGANDPDMTEGVYLTKAKSFVRVAGYLERFYIPAHQLPRLMDVAKKSKIESMSKVTQ